MATTTQSRSGMMTRAMNGAMAGIAGGIVFGALMAMMGMLPMIAMLVGSTSAVVGALVHPVISAGLGVLFALIMPALPGAATLAAGPSTGWCGGCWGRC